MPSMEAVPKLLIQPALKSLILAAQAVNAMLCVKCMISARGPCRITGVNACSRQLKSHALILSTIEGATV